MAKNIEVTLELDNRQYNRAIKQSERNTDQFTKNSSSGVDTLRNAFIALGGAALIGGITRIGAEFQDLQNSLNVVFGSVDAGGQAFERVKNFAVDTQFSVQTLTQAFIQLKGAGVEPTDRLLRIFADTASVTTDQMGTFQAALDLVTRSTAGGLGLEDLNRLADRGIPVFTILQDKLGLTRLEISEFGKTAEGARQIITALTDELEVRFGGALSNSENNISRLTNNLGDAFDSLANEIFQLFSDDLTTGLKNLTSLIENLTSAVKSLNEAGLELGDIIKTVVVVLVAILNPIGKIRAAFTGLVSGVKLFGRQFRNVFVHMGLGKSVKSIQHVLEGLGSGLLALLGINALFSDSVEETAEAIKNNAHVMAFEAEQARLAAEETERLAQETRRAAAEAAAFQKGYDEASKAIKNFKDKSEEVFDKNDPLSNYQEFLKQIIEQSNRSAVEFKFAGQALQFLSELYEKGLIATKTYEIAVERLNGILGIQTDETEETTTALERYQEALDSLPLTVENYNKLLEQLIELQTTGALKTGEFEKLLRQLDEAFGKNEGLYSFLDTLGQAQKSLSEDLAEAFLEGESAGKAFQDFFKRMVTQIIADILRLQIIQPILGSLFGVSFGAGGAVSGLTGGGLLGALGNLIPGRATGGPVMKSQPYIVGEKGPELFVPHSSGQVVPNNAMGGRTSVTYNINAVDARSFQQLVASDPEFIYNVTRVGARRQPG